MSQHALTFGETPTPDDRTFAALAHVSSLISAFIGPLLILLLAGDKGPYVRYHATQALALQAAIRVGTMVAGTVISALSVVTCGVGGLLALAAIPLVPILLVLPLWGAWLAWEGRWKGYPLIETMGR